MTLIAFGVIAVMVAAMASDYIDSHGTLFDSSGGEVNMAMATVGRMRSLIHHLRIR